MGFPTNQSPYSPAQGTTNINSYIYQPRDPTTADYNSLMIPYQRWVNTLNNSQWYLQSHSIVNSVMNASWVLLSSGGTSTETLTGNTGGAVGPDGASNINFTGATLYDVDGNPGTNTLVINPRINAYPVTPYVVGVVGEGGYQTIQSAMDAANLAGGGIVWITPGTYNETLTAYTNVHLVSKGNQNGPTTIINGGLTIDTTASQMGMYAEGIRFVGAGQSAIVITGANTSELSLLTCQVQSTTQDGITCSSPGLVTCQNTNFSASAGQANLDVTGDVQIRIYNSAFSSADTPDIINNASCNILFLNSIYQSSANITAGFYSIVGCQVSTTSTLPLALVETAGVFAIANTVVTSNSSATFLVDGNGVGTSGSVLYYGLGGAPAVAITFDPDLIQLPVNEYPFSTAGTTGTAVRGSCGFDSAQFTVTDGFVELNSGSGDIASVNVQTFTTNGTYTPTSGMVYAMVECVGGGAGGGGISATTTMNAASAGGGAGGTARVLLNAAAVGASQTVTVGAGGGGGNDTANGADGGTTSLGSLCVATGGTGGRSASNSNIAGDGGIGTTGDVLMSGGAGSCGFAYITDSLASFSQFGGAGGNSTMGAGGRTPFYTAGATGHDGRNFGGGGSGTTSPPSSAAQTGGDGADGVVVVTEYVQ